MTKHSAARSVRVRLTWDREAVTITIADDGPGFRTSPERPPGNGLIGMRKRASAFGGDLTTSARPDGGFLVTAHLPLPAAETFTRRPFATPVSTS